MPIVGTLACQTSVPKVTLGVCVKPHMKQVAELFSGDTRYGIPQYQREYEWNDERWHSLWIDIGLQYLTTQDGVGSDSPVHFIGAMIVESQGSHPGSTGTFSVIDGQQRLVTLLVLLAAILHHEQDLAGTKLPDDYGLFWPTSHRGEKLGPRIEVQQVDMGALEEIFKDSWRTWYLNARHKRDFEQARILAAYTYFRYCLWWGVESFREAEPLTVPKYRAGQANDEAESVWADDLARQSSKVGAVRQTAHTPIETELLYTTIMDRLQILSITIEPNDEDGPTIFDTMNAKRTELEQWDFIRSSVFMRLPESARGELFAKQWGPAQMELHKTKYASLRSNSRDAFVYDYLIARGESRYQSTINRNRGHEQFMKRISRLVGQGQTLESVVRDDFVPAAYAWVCAVGGSDRVGTGPASKKLSGRAAIARDTVMSLSAGPPIPVMLHFIDGWSKGAISSAELEKSLVILESYVARHIICQTPMSPYRAKFMAAMASLSSATTARQMWNQLKSDWKTDREVSAALTDLAMYGPIKPTQLGAIFRGIELQLSGTGSHPLSFGNGAAQYSVEHVFPKSPASGPNPDWQAELAQWKVSSIDQEKMCSLRHHIGNLTVVTNEANSKLGSKAFSVKKQAFVGNHAVKIPPLGVNADIQASDRWTLKQIDERRKILTKAILERWPLPSP